MFDVNFAKEILLIKNKDDTYNMTVKTDIHESNETTLNSEVEINYPRIKINKFDIEALVTNEIIYEVKI